MRTAPTMNAKSLTGWLVAFVLCATPALAQKQADASATEAESPWSVGVPQEQRNAAVELFYKGNALLKDGVFLSAAQQYREALKHWDHPAIHYNLVLALLNLDQPIEILHHVDQAMRHGPEPLDEDKYEQARAYKKLVQGQLARVKVACEVPGAQVVLDGKPLFTAPGTWEGWVRAGPHTIVASAPGYLTNEVSPALAAGDTKSVSLNLFKSEDLTQYRRKFSTWVPWTVMGASAAVGLIGGGLHYMAKDEFAKFDQEISACGAGGCIPTATTMARYDRGHLFQNVAVGTWVAGGAGVATGLVLLIINQPEAYLVTPQDLSKGAVTVTPLVGHTNGVAATFNF